MVPVLPSLEEFPYTIRCVSEVLSSNGSTSQASICGSTLALMDAGVPIKAPVAGISCGLITEGDRWMTMLDIQGVEDFHGDMDFKVGGTRKGITAIQMDIKIDGLTYDIIAEAFEKCRKGRLYILDEIIKPVIAEPRHELSRYIVFIMPLAAVLCHFLGANGVWHAFWITEVLSAIVAYPVYRKAVGKC